MAHVIENKSHPCYGLDCKDCEKCIFDVDLFNEDNKMKETCNKCPSLIRNYTSNDRVQFNACCDRSIINYVTYSRPRNIQYKVGPMLDIITPSWCPKARGITKEYKTYSEISSLPSTTSTTPPPAPLTVVQPEPKKILTYQEKRDGMLKLPKRTSWEEIEEGEVYVIPKILYQSRKVVRVVFKSDTCIRCSEIDEFGNESKTCSSVYPSDIDSVFITKLHKY